METMVSVERPVIEPDSSGRIFLSTELIIPNPDQPRKYFSPAVLESTGENMEQFGQEKPVNVMWLDKPVGKAWFMLIDGETRWRVNKNIGAPMWVVISPTITDPEELFERSLNSNFPQTPHTPREVIDAILRLENNGRTVKQMATIFGKSEMWIGTHKRLATLHPRVLALLGPDVPEDNQLPLMHASDIADLSHNEQIGMAEAVIAGGLSRAHLKHLIRMSLASNGSRQVSSSHIKKEMKGLVSVFTKVSRHLSLFVTHPAELDRIVGKQSKTMIAELIVVIEQLKAHLDVILGHLRKYHQEPLNKG